MSTRWAYFNGEWIDDRQLAIPVGDLGFALGTTVTERLRTFDREPFRKEQHLERMRRSMEIVGIHASTLIAELDAAIEEFLSRAEAHWLPGDDWAIVVFATPGIPGQGPTRCVHGFPLPFAGWAHQFAEGVELYVSDFRQTPSNCWPAELKCRSRMHYYLADQQARSKTPEARALLLDQAGFVGEGSTANVLIYNEDEGIVSPRLENVLPGVSIAYASELAEQLGIPYSERDITVEEFQAADEAWLCSTSICVLPVVRCNDQPIGDGKPGKQYQRLLARWGETVGIDIAGQAVRLAKKMG